MPIRLDFGCDPDHNPEDPDDKKLFCKKKFFIIVAYYINVLYQYSVGFVLILIFNVENCSALAEVYDL